MGTPGPALLRHLHAADSALAVWVQVKPGTPDATIMGDGHFVPANNRRELGRALDAEKRARGQ